jgi:hypothetical protein
MTSSLGLTERSATARFQTRREAPSGFCTGLDRRSQVDPQRSGRVGFATDAQRCSPTAWRMEPHHPSGSRSCSGNRGIEEGGTSSAQRDGERPRRQAGPTRRSGRQPDRTVRARAITKREPRAVSFKSALDGALPFFEAPDIGHEFRELRLIELMTATIQGAHDGMR